jgi:hypothetical protein
VRRAAPRRSRRPLNRGVGRCDDRITGQRIGCGAADAAPQPIGIVLRANAAAATVLAALGVRRAVR